MVGTISVHEKKAVSYTHLVADTIIRFINAVNRINRMRADKGAGSNEESKSAPMMMTAEFLQLEKIWKRLQKN